MEDLSDLDEKLEDSLEADLVEGQASRHTDSGDETEEKLEDEEE